jgi:hypothetical protein
VKAVDGARQLNMFLLSRARVDMSNSPAHGTLNQDVSEVQEKLWLNLIGF